MKKVICISMLFCGVLSVSANNFVESKPDTLNPSQGWPERSCTWTVSKKVGVHTITSTKTVCHEGVTEYQAWILACEAAEAMANEEVEKLAKAIAAE